MKTDAELTDSELLRAFARGGDESAFTALVRRHGGLVFGVALRRTGDWSVAEETAQAAFALLARKAPSLVDHPAPAAWLQRTAAFLAAKAMEKEHTRRRIMNDYAAQHAIAPEPEAPAWAEAVPHLDAAVASLPEPDRRVLVLRYWQNLPFRRIAGDLGSSVDACEKRASRALEKLSLFLRRQGVVLGAAALATGLSAQVAEASVPAATLARVAPAALAAGKSAGTAGLLSLITMKSKLTAAAGIAALLLLCGSAGWVAGKSSRSNPALAAGENASAAPAGGRPRAAPRPPTRPPRAGEGTPLHALLQAAYRDLLVSEFDPLAAARAAARVSGIRPEDIAAATELASDMHGLRGEMSRLVLAHWATMDPAAACSTAMHSKVPTFGIPLVADPLKVWAGKDPAAALAWLRQHSLTDTPEKPDGSRAISNVRWVFGAWAMQDMPAAVRAFRELKDEQEISGAITGLTEMAAGAVDRASMLDAVLAAKRQQKDNGMIWWNVGRVVERCSTQRPAELAAWVDAQTVPAPNHGALGKAVLKGWLRTEPEAAVQWWMQAPGGYPDKSGRINDIVEAWSASDVFAAAEWLVRQPLDAAVAPAMTTLAQKVATSDPERAMVWALSVPAGPHQTDAVHSVSRTWAQKDKAAATEAVNASSLPPEEKEKALRIIAETPQR